MNIKRGGSREPKKPPLDPPLDRVQLQGTYWPYSIMTRIMFGIETASRACKISICIEG